MVVGYTVGARVQDDAAAAWVLGLSVGRHYQGKSIGTALVSRLIPELAPRHVRRVFLSGAPDTIPAKRSLIGLAL